MKRLVINRIKCNKCGDVIESTYTHDFKWCKCHSVFVDGGLDYARRGGNLEDITELSVEHDFSEHPIRLENWFPSRGGLIGQVYSDPRRQGRDGTMVQTSNVVSHTREELLTSPRGTLVITHGAIYKLGEPYDFKGISN